MQETRQNMFAAALEIGLLQGSDVNQPSQDDWGSIQKNCGLTALGMLCHNVLCAGRAAGGRAAGVRAAGGPEGRGAGRPVGRVSGAKPRSRAAGRAYGPTALVP